jgi:hypothetical protein
MTVARSVSKVKIPEDRRHRNFLFVYTHLQN